METPTIQVGTYVEPDGWGIGAVLEKGLEGFCPFYLPTHSNGPIKHLAVTVEVTGRVPRRRCGGYYARVRIVFVGDGEPDVVHGGWVPYED